MEERSPKPKEPEALMSGASSMDTADSSEAVSWKKSSDPTRKPFEEGYQFGDLTRSLISSAMPHIREFSHTAREKLLEVKERHYEVTSDIVGGLIDSEEAARPLTSSGSDVEARRW